jgi:hypothetical protein
MPRFPSVDRKDSFDGCLAIAFVEVRRQGFVISKRIFRLGGMAPSEWMLSIRAVRDTQVADYSAPGVNNTRGIIYRPQITVSQSLGILSVSYFRRSLCRCGQQ